MQDLDLPEWKKDGVRQWHYLVVFEQQGESTHRQVVLPAAIELLVDNTLGGQFHVYRTIAVACGWNYNPVRSKLKFYNLTFAKEPVPIARTAFNGAKK